MDIKEGKKTNRKIYTEQVNIQLTPEESKLVREIAYKMRGTVGQVFRLSLKEFAEGYKKHK